MPPELEALQQAIEMLHQLMATLPDPKHTQVVAKCLQALTQVQQEMMTQGQGGGPQQAMLGQLSGQGAAPPGPGGGGLPPELMAALGGGGGMPQY